MSRKDDYIPANDIQFTAWLSRFATNLSSSAERLRLTPEQVAAVAEAHVQLAQAVEEQMLTRNAAISATGHKRTLRAAVEQMIRPLVGHINTEPGMDDELRGSLGLKTPARQRTRRSVGTEVPLLFPVAGNGRVAVHFGENPQNERWNKRPRWAQGCVIYRKKEGEEKYSIIGYATSSPFLDEIDENLVRVTYMAKYRGAGNSDLGGQSPEYTIAAGRGSAPPKPEAESEAA